MPKATRAKKRKSPRIRNLGTYRKQLDVQREQILDLYQHDMRVGQAASDEGSEDIVDRANSSYDREFMLALSDTERQILQEIDRAIERVDDRSFGVCLHCGEPIPTARLKALTWAKYCVDCQERAEQGVVLEG